MPTGPYELVDNNEYGSHKDALNWLSVTYPGPFSVATGFVGLGGLGYTGQSIGSVSPPVTLAPRSSTVTRLDGQ